MSNQNTVLSGPSSHFEFKLSSQNHGTQHSTNSGVLQERHAAREALQTCVCTRFHTLTNSSGFGPVTSTNEPFLCGVPRRASLHLACATHGARDGSSSSSLTLLIGGATRGATSPILGVCGSSRYIPVCWARRGITIIIRRVPAAS